MIGSSLKMSLGRRESKRTINSLNYGNVWENFRSQLVQPFLLQAQVKKRSFPGHTEILRGVRWPIVGKGTKGQAKGQKIRLASMSEAFPSRCVSKKPFPAPNLKNDIWILWYVNYTLITIKNKTTFLYIFLITEMNV